jgi:hypothetical protein
MTLLRLSPFVAQTDMPRRLPHVCCWERSRCGSNAPRGLSLTHCRHWLHRWVRPKIYSLADLLGGLMSTINAATICIAAAKANGTT